MIDQMVSAEDAKTLKASINGCIRALERSGIEKAHIGAAMAGAGLAIVHVYGGDFEGVITRIRDAFDSNKKQ